MKAPQRALAIPLDPNWMLGPFGGRLDGPETGHPGSAQDSEDPCLLPSPEGLQGPGKGI